MSIGEVERTARNIRQIEHILCAMKNGVKEGSTFQVKIHYPAGGHLYDLDHVPSRDQVVNFAIDELSDELVSLRGKLRTLVLEETK